MTDDQGNILWQNDFTPFGEETGESGFVERDGFYTGKKIDRDTGLYYFNARWYDPTLGRFITEDPVKDGVNWFSYVANNPLRYIDPTGLYIVRNTTHYAFYMQYQPSVRFGKDKLLLSEYGCAITTMAKAISAIKGKIVEPQSIARHISNFHDKDGNPTNFINWETVAEKNGLEARKIKASDHTLDEFKEMIASAEGSTQLISYGVELKYGKNSHFANARNLEQIDGKDYVEIDPSSINDVASRGLKKRSSWITRNGKIYVPVSEVKSLIEVKDPNHIDPPDPYRNGMNDDPSNGSSSSRRNQVTVNLSGR